MGKKLYKFHIITLIQNEYDILCHTQIADSFSISKLSFKCFHIDSLVFVLF